MRKTVSDGVIDQIITLLERGELHPGDKVPAEPVLATQLGVGRSSVREALKALQVIGLVDRRPEGTVISQNATGTVLERVLQSHFLGEQQDVSQLFHVRRLLEGEMAALAGRRMTTDALERLETLHREMEGLGDGDFERYFDLDMRFHRLVARGAGNVVLTRMWKLIQELLQAAQDDLRFVPDLRVQSNRNHRALLDAFRSGDPEQARSVTHVALERIEALLQSTLAPVAPDA